VRILSLLFFITFLFSKPLSIEEAFKSQFIPKKDGVEFNLKIADRIHVYKDSIKVLVNNKSIQVKLPLAKKDMLGSEIYEKEFKVFIPIKSGEIKVTYQGCSDDMVCYTPQTKTYKIQNKKDVKKDIKNNVQNNKSEDKFSQLFKQSIWVILGSFFIFGLLLSLTPCIFPMIPILAGLLSKSGKLSPAKGFFLSLVYVLSMSVTYTIAGVLAGLFGSNIQAMFQNPYIITAFSAIFVVLAFSMFGFFEIGLPASLQTKLTIKSNKAGESGGVLGIAIMGFLSALIVGPCVAPPLAGALIYIGQTGDALLGGSALFIMSIGMGMPLLILGLGAGKFMPRAGGWMIGVNRVFGVVMLGVAIWMISRVIPDNITMILWAILAIGSGLYLNPFSQMQNYKEVIFKTLGFILVVVGTIMIFKVMNPPIKIVEQNKLVWQNTKNLENLKGDVIVDFTAKWCVSCKEYEENTFSNPLVINKLKKYKLLRVDVTDNSDVDQKLMKKYEIVGPPAVLVFKDGKLIKKIIGYKPPKEFLTLLKK